MERLTLTLEDFDENDQRIGTSIRFDTRELEKIRFDNFPDVLDKLRDNIKRHKGKKDCLHKGCIKCKGTGLDHNFNACVHFLVCRCPECSGKPTWNSSDL